jgi:uncharacterized Zn-binding protein involved in type VI secretion
MPPAAKLGDVSTHGGSIVGPGEPTVLIGGMAAAVVGDMHVCTIPPPTAGPHLPSPFSAGSATVFIGGKPAVRVGDVCGCGASPAVGEPTVIIG